MAELDLAPHLIPCASAEAVAALRRGVLVLLQETYPVVPAFLRQRRRGGSGVRKSVEKASPIVLHR